MLANPCSRTSLPLLLQMVARNDYGRDEYAREFGLTISKDMSDVPGRVLNPPTVRDRTSRNERTDRAVFPVFSSSTSLIDGSGNCLHLLPPGLRTSSCLLVSITLFAGLLPGLFVCLERFVP